MVNERIKSQRNACLKAIDNSEHVDETDKILFRDLINSAADGTNGLSQEQKLQCVSETVFSLVMLEIMDKCTKTTEITDSSDSKPMNWISAIVSCKWAICVLGGIIALLLVLRPEFSAILIGLAS